MKEKSACVLAHCSHGLAEVKEESALDEFHHDVDEVVNDASGRLNDLSSITILVHVDDSLVLKVLQNCDLVVNRNDRIVVTAEEFFLQNLDSSVLLSSNKLA